MDMNARHTGHCLGCGLVIRQGDELTKVKYDGWVHADCKWSHYQHQVDDQIAAGHDQQHIINWLWNGRFAGDDGLLRNRLLEYLDARMSLLLR